MLWYYWVSVICLAICLAFLGSYFLRLIRLGGPKDFSSRRGEVGPAVAYSFTGAMSPVKKESAYLHLPTYTAGIIYHLGTFVCIFLFFLNLFQVKVHAPLNLFLSIFLLLTGIAGLGILFKRILKKGLRSMSLPDDYFSNLLVTGFHLLSAVCLLLPAWLPAYFIWSGVLLLYIPAGKLRHLLYFFAARFHLGYFYGWRGTWPPKKA
jgi:hypothetical protein